MKGDFTRTTFEPTNHFLRVLMQQGRVMLDADWNEQAAILLHYLQNLAADLIGPHGGPPDLESNAPGTDVQMVLKKQWGFEFIIDPARIDQFLELTPQQNIQLKELLEKSNPAMLIGKGRYYVDGILCEIDDYYPIAMQPDWQGDVSLNAGTYLFYVDVWERHITYIQKNDIREIALDGPDTSTRSKLVWQVKIRDNKDPDDVNLTKDLVKNKWSEWLEKYHPAPDKWVTVHRGKLKAQIKEAAPQNSDPCLISPHSKFRGLENQLYRVEIHNSGPAWDGGENTKKSAATFKWSRENGSVIFPIKILEGKTAVLEQLGRDKKHDLQEGGWVEILDDEMVLLNQPGLYYQVARIIAEEKTVILDIPEGDPVPVYGENSTSHPILRRWESELIIIEEESEKDKKWFDLEDQLQVQFNPLPSDENEEGTLTHYYRTGDFWLIPARTVTGNIEWLTEENGKGKKVPVAKPPDGVDHHYAPIALVTFASEGENVSNVEDCRCFIVQQCPKRQFISGLRENIGSSQQLNIQDAGSVAAKAKTQPPKKKHK